MWQKEGVEGEAEDRTVTNRRGTRRNRHEDVRARRLDGSGGKHYIIYSHDIVVFRPLPACASVITVCVLSHVLYHPVP